MESTVLGRWLGSGTALLTIVALAGCSSEASVASPWAHEFAEAREQAASEFERDILDDDQITREEYDEAVSRYLDCLEDRGFTASAQERYGLYTYSIVGGGPEADAAMDDCSEGTTWIIGGLYQATQVNPDNVDPDELYAACFVRNGLAEEGFGAAEMKEWVRTTDGTTPSGTFMSEDIVTQCLVNPLLDLGEQE